MCAAEGLCVPPRNKRAAVATVPQRDRLLRRGRERGGTRPTFGASHASGVRALRFCRRIVVEGLKKGTKRVHPSRR